MSSRGGRGQNAPRGGGRGNGPSGGRGSGDYGSGRGGYGNRGGMSGGGDGCRNCGQLGHFARECPNSGNPARGRGGYPSRGGDNFHGGRGGDFPRGDRRGGSGSAQSDGYGGGRGAPAGGASISGVPLFTTKEPSSQPDAEVTKAENTAVTKSKERTMEDHSLRDQIHFPRRPGHGSVGEQIVVRANYFKISPKANLTLYKYAVSIVPDERQSRRCRRLIELLIETEPSLQAMGGENIATDWRSTIITTKPLSLGEDNRKTGHISYYEAEEGPREKQPDQPPPLPRNYPQFTLSPSGTVSVQQLMDYLLGRNNQTRCNNKEDIIQALNIVMSRWPSVTPGIAGLKSGNKFFPLTNAPKPLGGGLVALLGYYTSVRTSTLRLLLNVNSITAAFYRSGPLQNLMSDFRGLEDNQTDTFAKLHRFLKGVRVKLTHLAKPKMKVIFGLARNPEGSHELGVNARVATFSWQRPGATSSSIVTVERFYADHHRRTLTHPTYPVVNVGNATHPILVPPEVCEVLDGQLCDAKLLSSQTKAMVEVAARDPQQNGELICGQGVDVMGLKQRHGPENFGLHIAPQMITIQARLLPPPAMNYAAPDQERKAVRPWFGSWNLMIRAGGEERPAKFYASPKPLVNWSYTQITWGQLNPNPKPQLDHLADVIDTLVECLRRHGIQVQQGVTLPERRLGIPKSGFETLIRDHFESIKRKGVKFLFVIIPTKHTALFDAIKKIADTRCGFQCVCMAADAKGPKSRDVQYFANVALKVNLKLGGINHTLPAGSLDMIEKGRTILLGIDVTHPSPNSSVSSPSIAACVANTDKTCGRWLGSIRKQEERRVEMVDHLQAMVVERLEAWRKGGKALPDNILVYRDGVSEGQYSQVLEREVPCIGKAINQLYRNVPRPKVSVVVVGKRHHTRFFATKEADTVVKPRGKNHTGNLKPGLVVDRGVTSEMFWDFYVQAHDGIKGTARPAHYVVIKDEIGLGASQLEKMTHNLCYMWGRATKAVSICPPAYYADVLCTRARCYLTENADGAGTVANWQPPHDDIKETMFFV